MKMGMESVPEMLENFDTLTWLSAQEDFTECWTQIRDEILYIYIY
jgi:hypothetical protein